MLASYWAICQHCRRIVVIGDDVVYQRGDVTLCDCVQDHPDLPALILFGENEDCQHCEWHGHSDDLRFRDQNGEVS